MKKYVAFSLPLIVGVEVVSIVCLTCIVACVIADIVKSAGGRS